MITEAQLILLTKGMMDELATLVNKLKADDEEMLSEIDERMTNTKLRMQQYYLKHRSPDVLLEIVRMEELQKHVKTLYKNASSM